MKIEFLHELVKRVITRSDFDAKIQKTALRENENPAKCVKNFLFVFLVVNLHYRAWNENCLAFIFSNR